MWTYLIDVNLRKDAKKTRVKKRLDYVLNWFCSNHSRHRNNIIGRTYVIIYCSKEFDKEQNSCEPCKSRRKMTVTMFHINSSSHNSRVFCILWEVGAERKNVCFKTRLPYAVDNHKFEWVEMQKFEVSKKCCTFVLYNHISLPIGNINYLILDHGGCTYTWFM